MDTTNSSPPPGQSDPTRTNFHLKLEAHDQKLNFFAGIQSQVSPTTIPQPPSSGLVQRFDQRANDIFSQLNGEKMETSILSSPKVREPLERMEMEIEEPLDTLDFNEEEIKKKESQIKTAYESEDVEFSEDSLKNLTSLEKQKPNKTTDIIMKDNEEEPKEKKFKKPHKVGHPVHISHLNRRDPNRVPAYLKNENKWKHYSLEDTKVLSDDENRTAALSFLTSLSQKEAGSEEDGIFYGIASTAKGFDLSKLKAGRRKKMEGKNSDNQSSVHVTLSHVEEGLTGDEQVEQSENVRKPVQEENATITFKKRTRRINSRSNLTLE